MAKMVPLGVADYSGNASKGFVTFSYEISEEDATKVILQIRNGSTVIYEEIVTDKSRLTQGEHDWNWDGFNNSDVLDTALLTNSKKLNFYVKVEDAEGNTEFTTQNFEADPCEVKWVDVKIDKSSKRIDVTLRVKLDDGGAKGLNDWDDIPKKALKSSKSPIKTRTKSFKDLEKMALDGINYHWGRNKNHSSAKNVDINGDLYEVFVNTINTSKKTMDDVELIYNTNRKWMRSGNPGTVEDPISFVGNLISREAICYNIGYIKYSNGWGYNNANDEDIAFEETSAHEIGHTILKAYGGTFYSYGHKGSVNTVTQSQNSNATNYPKTGEIDLMKYYKDWIPDSQKHKMAAAEKDVLSFIWLTKLELK